ncbi:hypothetical protein POJ06DRAFT_261574 [Lipomyces tetrasporus]|uniref:L domain-like protein n=1 Tax=Lipomyces tetrasporus TaxID=54092 RepID=A0AAD7VQ53_9ASCO|nr:uncharacterized protein POJ06DRAFT_261574 [Lipomyces tetrasporus]KAJ8097511.1 hypothetical protein POJ06DRAFT_261574 [Lipomyces tetrasporus]
MASAIAAGVSQTESRDWYGDGSTPMQQSSAQRLAQVQDESFPDWADPELSEEWISQPNSPIMSPKKASDSVSSRPTTASSGAVEGTTRILTEKDPSNEQNKAATPEWKKMSNPKDFFSPMTLERMFEPNLGDLSFTSSHLRHSKDTHLRLKASLSKLKSELDKVSPILGPMQPLKENRLVTVRNSVKVQQAAKENRVVPSEDGKENKVASSTIEEGRIEDENENPSFKRLQAKNIKPATVNSPHPPQQKNFNFNVTKTMKMSRPLSASKLDLFQSRDTDTYTKSKAEGSLARTEELTSDQGDDGLEPGPDESVDVKPLSPGKERISKRPRLELSKAHVTTQDFMSQAEHIMDMLRGLKKPAHAILTEDDFSHRQSELTSGSHNQSEYESVSLSEERPRKYALRQSESFDNTVASKSASSEGSYHDENEGLDEDDLRPHSDIYYDSIRNTYETSSTQLGAAAIAGPQSKQALATISLNPLSHPPATARQQSQNKVTEPIQRPAEEAPTPKSYKAAPTPTKSPLKKTATPNTGHPTMSSNASSKKSSSSVAQTGAMVVILKEQYEKPIPVSYGSMVYDDQNHRWIKHSKEAAGNDDEDDVFKGIEDLTDGAADNNLEQDKGDQQQDEVFIDEYRNSLQRSLSSLEETLSRKSSSESDVMSHSLSPPMHQQSNYSKTHHRGHNTHRSVPIVTQETVRSTPSAPSQHQKMRPTTIGAKPEVSFALPPKELRSPYAPDISYVESRHDATAVSQLESSFSLAVQNLVKILSDIHPFDPYWQDITILDLQDRDLETLLRLEEWCPQLLDLNVNENHLGYLTGVPETTRVLRAAHNNLSELTAFGFLSNLQYVDLSDNQIETLDGMSRLVHLRELIVDNNELVNIDGIMQLDGLLRLSVRGNNLVALNLDNSNLARLDDLDVSSNRLQSISGLERLKSLMLLNLDDNSLSSVCPDGYLVRLRTLKICRNELKDFDAVAFPNLRILYLDDNRLQSISGLKKLRLLENLSIRDQHGTTNELHCPNLTDVRKLYLSGNRPKDLTFQQHFLNLQSLELASVQLKDLPQNFSSFARNLRDLNLSFNELSSISNLKCIPKLRRLYLIGNQIKGMEHLANVISTFPALRVLDMRMNPLTLTFYPPVFAVTDHKNIAEANTIGCHSMERKDLHRRYNLVMSRQAQSAWEKKDKQFESHLARLSLMKRQAYQGLMFTSAPKLLWLDGASFTKEAVSELSRILERVTLNVERGRGAKIHRG